MSASISALLASESGISFECEGKKYRVSYITQEKAILFEDYLERYHVARLKQKKDFLTPEQYAEEAAALGRQLDEMAFAYDKPLARELVKQHRHGMQFAAILFGESADTVARLMQIDADGVNEILTRVGRRSDPEPQQGNGEAVRATST